MEKQEMEELLEKIESIKQGFDRELADSVMEVSIRANWHIVNELRGDDNVCQALLEIMEPEINKIKAEAVANAVADAVAGTKADDIFRAVKGFRELGADDGQVRRLLMENYVLSAEEADKYI